MDARERQAAYCSAIVRLGLINPEVLQALALQCSRANVDLRAELFRRGLIDTQSDARVMALLGAPQDAAQRPQLPANLPAVGAVFAGYRIDSELARGGGGAVFVATGGDGRRYAVKVMLGDLSEGAKRQRFEREVEIGTTLRHPGIVQVLDHGIDAQRAYLVMELLDGALPLDRYVEEHQVPYVDRVRLVMEGALAVSAAHAAGIVHRDLKPDNILVTPDGQVKVVDFGIAKRLDRERLTQSGVQMGTLHYMAPEQVRGEGAHADARTDVHALGAVLYRLLTGALPFEGQTGVEVMAKIMKNPVGDMKTIVGLPRGCSEVVRVAMAKNSDERYADAGELARDLAAVCSGTDTEASSRSRDLTDPARGKKRRVAAAVLVLIALAGGLGAWLALRPKTVDPDELRREALSIHEEAWTLFEQQGLFAADAATVDALQARLDSHAEEQTKALIKARRRVAALRGLVALSAGERDVAEGAVAEHDRALPSEDALRGALLASGEPKEASKAKTLLSAALGRGITRAELHGWRAQACATAGFSGESEAQEVLAGLNVLAQVRGGRLSDAETHLRVAACLAAKQPDDAQAALGELSTEPEPELRWRVALAQVELLLQTDPAAALERVSGLPAGEHAQAERDRIVASSLKQVRGVVRQLSQSPLTKAQETSVVVWLRLARALAPDDPIPADCLDPLHNAAVSIQTPEGRIPLAVALADLAPDNYRLQYDVARLVTRNQSDRKNVSALLPSIRRAVALATTSRDRVLLRTLLFGALRDVTKGDRNHDEAICEEALDAGTKALARNDDPTERVAILWRRADLHLHLNDPGSALRDANDALEIDAGEVSAHYYRCKALKVLGKPEPYVKAVATMTTYALGTEYHRDCLKWSWALGQDEAHRADAMIALRRLLEARPKDAGWWVRLAWLQLRSGAPEAAKRSVRAAQSNWSHVAKAKPLTSDLEKVLGALNDPLRFSSMLDSLERKLERLRGNGSTP